MTGPINYQTIEQGGKPAFVVIPYDEFLRLHPEIEQKDGIPHEVVHNMIHKDISRIRAWREHFGLTQKELAKKMGISQAAMSQIEAIGARPRKSTLEKLSKVLNLSLDQLK